MCECQPPPFRRCWFPVPHRGAVPVEPPWPTAVQSLCTGRASGPPTCTGHCRSPRPAQCEATPGAAQAVYTVVGIAGEAVRCRETPEGTAGDSLGGRGGGACAGTRRSAVRGRRAAAVGAQAGRPRRRRTCRVRVTAGARRMGRETAVLSVAVKFRHWSEPCELNRHVGHGSRRGARPPCQWGHSSTGDTWVGRVTVVPDIVIEVATVPPLSASHRAPLHSLSRMPTLKARHKVLSGAAITDPGRCRPGPRRTPCPVPSSLPCPARWATGATRSHPSASAACGILRRRTSGAAPTRRTGRAGSRAG